MSLTSSGTPTPAPYTLQGGCQDGRTVETLGARKVLTSECESKGKTATRVVSRRMGKRVWSYEGSSDEKDNEMKLRQ